jgi:hypothetical protein
MIKCFGLASDPCSSMLSKPIRFIMVSKPKTFALVGVKALLVEVEVDLAFSGLPKQVKVSTTPRKWRTLRGYCSNV